MSSAALSLSSSRPVLSERLVTSRLPGRGAASRAIRNPAVVRSDTASYQCEKNLPSLDSILIGERRRKKKKRLCGKLIVVDHGLSHRRGVFTTPKYREDDTNNMMRRFCAIEKNFLRGRVFVAADRCRSANARSMDKKESRGIDERPYNPLYHSIIMMLLLYSL